MDLTYLSPIINILLIVAFIVDRLFRLKSIKEYKEAKEAQIENLKQQLELERKNNDTVITEMHKKRNENLKIILEERENELNKNHMAFLELKSALDNAAVDADFDQKLNQKLVEELIKIEESKNGLEDEKKALQELFELPNHHTKLSRLSQQP